ncbi:CRISPR-associated helicase Cas3' [Paenibacillus sp. y28]|uniref:CRISPR-associated helicase Cas3' n=1 Tax=Paenibacillus sp. y28 TaxID=3129110 RepID=UPI0030189ACC
MDYIAHIRHKDSKIQTVQQHLEEVRAGCERNGDKIGATYLAGLTGLLHDMGKHTDEFKTYIQEAFNNPGAPPRRGSVDHSTAGGRLLYRRYHQKAKTLEDKLTAEWLANCIISHHQGLRDFLAPELDSPFLERVAVKELKEYEQAEAVFFDKVAASELDRYFAQARDELADFHQKYRLSPIIASLLMKYIFSCLIDADRTNTRQFEEDEQPEPHTSNQSFFERSYDALMNRLGEYDRDQDADKPINRLRRDMSLQCEAAAMRPSGIYTLSIPTGGGKTLASLRYALKHALEYGKERIIYVVPYTTIIEQNAAEIRDILQEHELILEHHSNVIEEQGEEGEDYDVRKKSLKLARDTWDRPIIFTTMVQFLNTFYGKGTRNVRRLHQLANAVLIFDEVQSVPVKCISLFNAALNFLYPLGRSSVLLCTATQPALDFVKHKLNLSEQAELIENISEVGHSFKRVEVLDRTTPLGWGAEELASFVRDKMVEVQSVLIILNTKTAVRKLFARLEEEPWLRDTNVKLFHLSTNMCAAHRKDELSRIKAALKAEERVICVSTQLIEAGVNISFECAIRSLAGLDSIAQAAGRCNRHGKDALREVYIIQAADESLTHLPEIRIGAEMTKRILYEFEQEPGRFGHDLLSASAMQAYFEYYYTRIQNEMDYPIPKLGKQLFDLLHYNKDYFAAYRNKRGKNPEIISRSAFATVEQHFEVISSSARSVLVPYNEEAREFIEELNGELEAGELGTLLRKLQPYVVNMFEHEFRKLHTNQDVYPLLHGHVLALREIAYSKRFGVETDGEGEWQSAIV